ncbi:UNVERIFIED_CONTAM: hypothetical protein FKN15_035849 [Acipenser sinensis]
MATASVGIGCPCSWAWTMTWTFGTLRAMDMCNCPWSPGNEGDDSRYRNAALFLNGRLPTVPGMNCPTIQYEACSSCCTVPSPVEREIVDSDSFALRHNHLPK